VEVKRMVPKSSNAEAYGALVAAKVRDMGQRRRRKGATACVIVPMIPSLEPSIRYS